MNNTRTIDALRRFWWIVVAFTIVGGVVAGLPSPEDASESITEWNASHTLLLVSGSSGGYSDGVGFNQLQLFTTVGEVPARVAAAIDYDGPPAVLASQISVIAEQQSGAFRITTTQATAEEAVQIADSFADELVSYLAERQDSLREERLTSSLTRLQGLEGQLTEAQDAVVRNPDDSVARAELDAFSRQYSVAFEQYNSLQLTDQGSLVLTTLERAQPVPITSRGLTAPQSRRARGTLGALVGIAMGVGLAVLLSRTDRKVRSREQVEQLLGATVHATIPYLDNHEPGELAVVPNRHDPLSDSYRTVRSIIAFADSNNKRPPGQAAITVVVSPGPGDGKTSMSANLASAYVEAGSRTVAVNTDFRRPTLSRRLSVPVPKSLGLDFHQIEHLPLELVLLASDNARLKMLDLSPIKEASPGDLARVTARMLPKIAAIADAVVVDTSPIGATAEVLEFLPIADTIVMTVRLGHTSIATAIRSIEMIRSLSTGNIVLALVGGEGEQGGYYYYAHSAPTLTEKKAGRFGRKKAPGEETKVNS